MIVGVTYELLDLCNRRRFTLGKWYTGARFLPELLIQRPVPDMATFVAYAGLRWAEEDGVPTRPPPVGSEPEDRLRRIWRFCADAHGDVVLVNDSGDLVDVVWPRAGSIYSDPVEVFDPVGDLSQYHCDALRADTHRHARAAIEAAYIRAHRR